MFIKNVKYSNGKCILSFKDANWKISLPIKDDPGLCPNDELIITDTRIWKIVRLYCADPETEFIPDNESWNDADVWLV